MEETIAPHQPANWAARLVGSAMRAPHRVFASLVGLHLIVWTGLPILVCRNLQLDLAEGLALGREWQLCLEEGLCQYLIPCKTKCRHVEWVIRDIFEAVA